MNETNLSLPMKKLLSLFFLAALISCQEEEPFIEEESDPDITGLTGRLTDYDGNSYSWIGIGKQAWMAENLKTTHYSDGTAIPYVEETPDWANLHATDKAYCWYKNSAANRTIYGGLYTWAAAVNGTIGSSNNPSDIQGVCPDGWHLPSNSEWSELVLHLGGTDSAGYKLKETGSTHWPNEDSDATNESGFTALPGGSRYPDGKFNSFRWYAYFWTATENLENQAYHRSLFYQGPDVPGTAFHKEFGFSVRCIRDNP